MRYWDPSALVPLLVPASTTALVEALLQQDVGIATWWGSLLECESALRRREREGHLPTDAVERARTRLRAWHADWTEVEAGDRLREVAVRLLAVHPLRTSDALQLSAAVTVAKEAPGLPFVTLDRRLGEAARREGFEVLPAPGSLRG